MTQNVAAIAGAMMITLAANDALARCADWTPQPKPQNVGRDIVGQDYDTIVENGSMLFAVYEDFPPYSYREGGEAKGVDVEIAKLIAEFIGVKAEFNFVGSGENLEADLRTNIWKGGLIGGRIANVMMRVPYESEFTCRVEQVVFTGQYYNETLAIAYDAKFYTEDLPVPAYFRFDEVGVENDSLADFYLSSVGNGMLLPNIKRYPTPQDAMAALEQGEVKAVMGPLAQLEWELSENVGVHQPPLPGLSRGSWTLGVGVNFRYRQLAYAVDDAIQSAVQDGRIASIFADYGLTYTEASW